jgi:thymidine kinase
MAVTENFSWMPPQGGWIEVVVGCMFSGKSEELIRRVRLAQRARLSVQAFKPRIDARYHEQDIASHDQNRTSALAVQGSEDIMEKLLPSTQVVAIDEGQFFDAKLVEVATQLAQWGRRVIVAGLDTDWRGRPFGVMPELMAVAEVVSKRHAVCQVCGAPANRTQRLVAAQDDILVGASEAYEARCRRHFDPLLALDTQRTTSEFLVKMKTLQPNA